MRGSRMLTAMLALLSASCPGPIDLPDVGPRPDATLDAHGPRDATLDAPFDGGPTDPGWVAPRGLPDGCLAERATHPERLPSLSWNACGSGCLRAMRTDWPTLADGWFADGRGWLRVSSSQMFEDRRVTAAVPVDSPITDAWRYTRPGSLPFCGIFQITTGQGRSAAVVNYLPGRGADGADLFFVHSGTVSEATAAPVLTLLPPMVGGFRYTEDVSVSAELVGFRLGATTSAVLHAGSVVLLTSPAAVRGSDVRVHDDHAVFGQVMDEWRLMHWTSERGTEVYYDPTEQVGEPQLYGDSLVWVQYADFVDGSATRAELWEATFVLDPADLEPRLVHRDVVPTDAIFADATYGWLWSPGPDFVIHLVDVPSGRERTIRPGPEVNCTRLLYVSSRDVAAECFVDGFDYVYRFDPGVVAVEVPRG